MIRDKDGFVRLDMVARRNPKSGELELTNSGRKLRFDALVKRLNVLNVEQLRIEAFLKKVVGKELRMIESIQTEKMNITKEIDGLVKKIQK